MVVSLPALEGLPDGAVYRGRVLSGVELIGITAGEAKNPQVTLRSAVGKVLWRILIFYVGAILLSSLSSRGIKSAPTAARSY